MVNPGENYRNHGFCGLLRVGHKKAAGRSLLLSIIYSLYTVAVLMRRANLSIRNNTMDLRCSCGNDLCKANGSIPAWKNRWLSVGCRSMSSRHSAAPFARSVAMLITAACSTNARQAVNTFYTRHSSICDNCNVKFPREPGTSIVAHAVPLCKNCGIARRQPSINSNCQAKGGRMERPGFT